METQVCFQVCAGVGQIVSSLRVHLLYIGLLFGGLSYFGNEFKGNSGSANCAYIVPDGIYSGTHQDTNVSLNLAAMTFRHWLLYIAAAVNFHEFNDLECVHHFSSF